ncbi:HNH endonuclease [Haloarcula halophila]|uniref:HNH endonuclease n=1 Tax=Haloarcula TaxID=2237 RepID=UPI0030104ED9
MERYPSQVQGEVTLCSRDCHSEWLSDGFTGDGHPNWRGGGIDDYGPGWNAVRERALDRDGNACVVCGDDADDIGRNPDVHHVVPVRLFAASPVLAVRDAHTLDNVVSLCPACHRRAEFGQFSRAELRWRAGIAFRQPRAASACGPADFDGQGSSRAVPRSPAPGA